MQLSKVEEIGRKELQEIDKYIRVAQENEQDENKLERRIERLTAARNQTIKFVKLLGGSI